MDELLNSFLNRVSLDFVKNDNINKNKLEIMSEQMVLDKYVKNKDVLNSVEFIEYLEKKYNKERNVKND